MRSPGDTPRFSVAMPVIALLAVLCVGVLPGCGARGTGTGPERVPMVVENQNFYQATIYALLNGSRVRVGDVQGGNTATFQAPNPPTGQMRVEVRLLAVGAYTSYPITVLPGDTVRVTVPPDLHLRAPRRP